jgi:hypothetical protein
MRKTCVLGLALLFLALAIPASDCLGGGDKDKDVKKKANIWMRTKLEFSRNILAGLTDGDFDKITKSAEALNVATFFEVLFRPSDPDYKHQVLLFLNSSKEIVRQAREKNLYGATLAYNQLMVSCVQCHQMVRDAKK